MRCLKTAVVLTLAAVLGGCALAGGSLGGTAAAGLSAPDSAQPPDDPAAVEVSALLESPADYEGQYVRVAGSLRQVLPEPCQTKRVGLQPPWRLSSADGAIPVTGADDLLRRPALPGLDVIAEGRWMRWQGPAGCGRQLAAETIWFLQVRRVAAPNPVAYVPIAREGQPDGEVVLGDQEAPAVSATAAPTVPVATATPAAAAGEPLAATTAAGSSLPTPSRPPATPTAGAMATGYPGLTPTAAPAGATLAATPTPENGAATPAGEPVEIERPLLEVNSLETGRLGTDETHRWPLVITTTTVLTVNVAAELGFDVAVAVRDAAGNVLAEQDGAATGRPELLAGVALTAAGTYDVVVSAPAGGEGSYAILALDAESYTFIFQQTVAYDQPAAAAMAAENDHFWQFYGQAGDVITITATPEGEADLFMRLFDEVGDVVVTLRNDGGPGEPEELAAVVLTADGLYSVLVGELNFGPAAYTILISPGI